MLKLAMQFSVGRAAAVAHARRDRRRVRGSTNSGVLRVMVCAVQHEGIVRIRHEIAINAAERGGV